MNATKPLEFTKENKSAIDNIDKLINKVFADNNYSFKKNKARQINPDYKKWIMPEEPQRFLKCKKYDPL
ncbi:MAG TPA: hypothetical protein VKR53_18500 [Puia sp.]|nr:hypothetical protein [Puia sp.]